MRTVQIYKLLKRRVLVTRDSARAIRAELVEALVEGQGGVVLDFSGVAGVTPSFFDETLGIIEESMLEVPEPQLQVTIENPPTQLSSKFTAVGRGHGLSISESDNGAWVISKVEQDQSKHKRHHAS